MTWIQTISPASAQGDLAEIYAAVASARGGVAAIHIAQSLNPRAIRAHLELYKAVVFARSSLSRVARERIAVVVSYANRCAYCVNHHAAALRSLGDAPHLVEALGRGDLEPFADADRALLSWARRAATEPATTAEGDVAGLRAAGLDDRAILDAVLTVSYFSFVNRIVLLLGVELEDGFEQTCRDDAGERT